MAKSTTTKKKTGTKQSAKSAGSKGAPFSEQDPKRRLGNFGGAGEHPRQGGRGGVVGQTTKKNHTDKKGGAKKR
jgi:hypothetical protein